MGKGIFNAGKFDLILSVRWNADANTLNQWKASFNQASRLLFDATNGKHSFNNIYVCNDSKGGNLADAYLLQNDADSSPGVPGLGTPGGAIIPQLGVSGTQQTLGADERFKPYVIIHEFGHYAYGLGEEYNALGQPQCVPENTHACIMEFDYTKGDQLTPTGALIPGTIREFCYPGNHTGNNEQQSKNMESCWKTMVDKYPDLPIPTSQPGATPGMPPDINWILLQQEQRFVLVLDKSGSMATNNKLTEMKRGAKYWVDFAVERDKIAVVAYADTATEVYPLTEITAGMNRTPIKDAIENQITAGGNTSIGGGLREGLNKIRGNAPNNRAASQAIALVTDGLHNTGEAPDGPVLQDLINFGVRVYTIGIGPSINSSLLQKIATDTGGEFRRIDPTHTFDEQANELRDALITFQGIAHDNGEIVITIPGSTNPGVQEEVVRIEERSEMATFTLSWRNANDLLFLELVSPEGITYTLDSFPENARPIYSDQPYMGFQVTNPAAGLWTLRVKPERVEKIAYYKLFVISQNTRLHGSLVSASNVCNTNDPITLYFLGYFDRPITGLDVTGTATLPGGTIIPLEFNKAPENGIYQTTFTQTRKRGMYSFNVIVKGEKGSVSYARPHWPNESNEGDPIPTFQREYSRTVAVSEEPIEHVSVEPNSGVPGQTIRVTLKGSKTHFTPDSTSFDFGDGISVSDIEVVDNLTASVTLNVAKAAALGLRSITATTAAYNEVIKLVEGFQVVRRKWAWSDKWIIRLLLLFILLLIILLLTMTMLFVRGR